MVSNEHISRETKHKYSNLIGLLPDEFRKGYKLYTSKGDDVVSTKVEKLVTDPYMNPLMAESHKGKDSFIAILTET